MMSHLHETGSRSNADGNAACSICGTLNAHDAEFCRCCGVSITRASEHTALLQNSGFCPTCQSAHATPARFCDQCGGKLPGYVRPPDSSSWRVGEAAGTAPPDLAGMMPVSGNSKTGETSGPPAAREGRRLSPAPYLIMPAVFAAALVGMYFSGYRITQVDATEFLPAQAAVLHPAATPSPVGQYDGMNDLVFRDDGPIEPAPAEPSTGAGAQAQPPVPPPTAVKPPARPLRLAMRRGIVKQAYEEPVSAIRELPAMPVHDFKSVVQLDTAGN